MACVLGEILTIKARDAGARMMCAGARVRGCVRVRVCACACVCAYVTPPLHFSGPRSKFKASIN